jgi:putative membrane-bound dehydrogenase-like protein
LLGADQPPLTGPQTEKRFPPLLVPTGFKATLFACDPLIEYPSAISIGPRPGAIFVAFDYMTGLGTEIIRRDEIRLFEDTDGDGYADKATVFAKGFNSIQGLAYHQGTLYVMHAPFLTALRDTKGTGVADERRDLLTGLGLTPEENPVRLHRANGVVAGADGWLYLALGDHGVVLRAEGDRLVLQGGGILRCRPDGRDLHVFATGLRNIYDIALDAEQNVFVRDNENDGGTYMIRVCHSFQGADHGYPYHYEERPNEALPPLADLGLGSSAGGLCYLERQFPPAYRGNLFFCEWGRSVVRYELRRAGSAFAPVKEIEFATGAANDPYGFKPTDLVVQRDGTLMVADWADGQRPRRGRGRIYHIAYVGNGDVLKWNPSRLGAGAEQWLAQLNSPSYYDRCEAQAALETLGRPGMKALTDALKSHAIEDLGRLHAIWILAKVGGTASIDELLRISQTDPAPSVRAQAVRAVADLADPVLSQHRLNAGPGDTDLVGRLANLAQGQHDLVLLEVINALGRLHWSGSPDWLRLNLLHTDAALEHASMQTLRRCGNWPAVLKLLDEPNIALIRGIALRAVAERFEPVVVDGLIDRLRSATDAQRRREYADLLTRVYQKPGAWVYWGYRPPARPANSVTWERTEAIVQALNNALADSDRSVRLAMLQRMQREKIPALPSALSPWLQKEHEPAAVIVLLNALRYQPAATARPYLDAIVRDQRHSSANRAMGLALFVGSLSETSADLLLKLVAALEDSSVMAEALRSMAKFPKLQCTGVLASKLHSSHAEVRAAAIDCLAERGADEGRQSLLTLLQDADARVRRAATRAAGKLGARQAADRLLILALDPDPDVCRNSLESLRLLRDPRVLPVAVACLQDGRVDLKALECIADLGGPLQTKALTQLAQRKPSADVLAAVVRVLTAWKNRQELTASQKETLDRAVAEIHGATGILTQWISSGPLSAPMASQISEQLIHGRNWSDPPDWHIGFASGTEARVHLSSNPSSEKVDWLAYTNVAVPERTPVEFLASSGGSFQVWLNGQSLHRHDGARDLQIDSDRFGGVLASGVNRLVIHAGGSGEFHLRFRRKSALADHERLTQLALTRAGNVERGRQLFFDIERSQCLKCHWLNDRGERIGPELTGVGSRFSRIYLVDSILDPSRTIAPSFETLVISLKNGQVITGVKVAETQTTLTLADTQVQKHVLTKSDIEEQHASQVSTMPEGLEKRFSAEEFTDLIAFLVSQQKNRAP